MSLLKQLPDFLNAQGIAKSGKWSVAKAQFLRSADVMTHANQSRDAAIAKLHASTCSYYSGDFIEAKQMFASVHSQLDCLASDPVKMMAGRYTFATSFIDARTSSDLQSILYRARNSTDMWTHLSVGDEPPIGSYPRAVQDFIRNEGESWLMEGGNSTERIAYSYALLSVAEAKVNKLPMANVDSLDLSDHVSMVTRSLRGAEAIASDRHPDLEFISKFFVAQSLLLRGKLFAFNANALMAEGMYRAAMELTESRVTPRLELVNIMARNYLGDLLLKWERREREGEDLLDTHHKPEGIGKRLSTFILEPTFDELERLL